MSRFITMKLSFDKLFNPDLPDDLWTKSGIQHPRTTPITPMVVTWGDSRWEITDPDVASLILEVGPAIRSLKAHLKKWEEAGKT